MHTDAHGLKTKGTLAELVPIPLGVLVRRAFLEYEREGKIFDLPKQKFFRGLPGLDLSVSFHGHRAATPLGPAAGPHTQLAQNIVLCWLGGARIIELKTVQVLDELKIPRPSIDAANVGYNVEWSQELRLEQSLREYVSAAMLLEILQAANLPGGDLPGGFVFDMSVGYDLNGIRSPRVRAWIEGMKNAAGMIDELRRELPREYRDLPFPAAISDSVSLSTFHGCPANEIEGIATFLLEEMDCHVCVKLNPTLLGEAEVERLLHDELGYDEIQLHRPAFQNDLQWDEAEDLIPRLYRLAQARGKSLAVKICNTLVVKNHKGVLSGDVMYLSGAPLHVIALRLAEKFRERVEEAVPISFSGGLDARNIAATVAKGFVPVTTCTDLLRPGGYGRLIRYLENLGAEMRALGVSNIPDFIRSYRGGLSYERYSWARNRGVPRKIGSKLWLYDCINCDKCVPVCPNDANFVYETEARMIAYDNYELDRTGLRRVPGGVLRIVKAHQLANYADACNDCGNCDVFCPEDGGPNAEKPRFFGSFESYQQHAGESGFFVDWEARTMHGTLGGQHYVLSLGDETARFSTDLVEVVVRLSDGEVVEWRTAERVVLDMLPYFKLKLLLEAAEDSQDANFVTVGRTYGHEIRN
jgi:putative selenate reductase